MGDYGGQNKWQEIAGGLGEGMGYLGQQMQQNAASKQQQQLQLQKLLLDMDTSALSKGYVRTQAEDPNGQDLFGTGIKYRKSYEAEQESALNQEYDAEMVAATEKAYPQLKGLVSVGMNQRFVNSLLPKAQNIQKTNLAIDKDRRIKFDSTVLANGNIMTQLNRLETASRKLKDLKPGVFEQIKGKGYLALGNLAQDPDVAEYYASADGLLAMFARKIMGEVGVLTNQDIERAEAMRGNESAPLETKIKLIEELRDTVRRNTEIQMENAGYTPEELKESNPLFYQSMGGEVWYQQYLRRKAEAQGKVAPAIGQPSKKQEAPTWIQTTAPNGMQIKLRRKN